MKADAVRNLGGVESVVKAPARLHQRGRVGWEMCCLSLLPHRPGFASPCVLLSCALCDSVERGSYSVLSVQDTARASHFLRDENISQKTSSWRGESKTSLPQKWASLISAHHIN